MASSTVLEDFRMCERENELLREKLHVHLDRWGFDRSVLDESVFKMAKEHVLKSTTQTYELAKADLLHGMQIQRNFVLQIQSESAQDEIEFMKPQVLGLKFALQQEKVSARRAAPLVNTKVSREQLKKLKSALQEKFVQESRKKSQQWQTVLENRQRGYMEAVKKIKEKCSADTKQLNVQLQQLMSEIAELKMEREQWKLDKGELQNLASERQILQAELEKVQSSLVERNRILADKEQKLQQLASHRDLLTTKIEKWETQKEEMQGVLEEREKLQAEKERWAVKEHEMEELAVERENLLFQRDEWISQEKALQELRMERDQLKRKLQGKESEEFYNSLKERDKFAEKLDVVRSQREEEVKGLIRERDFVWSQMKKIEEDYTEKLIRVSGQLVQSNQEIWKLRNELQQSQTECNEKTVEMTILKLEAKRAEDDITQLKDSIAASTQVRNQGKTTDLCTTSKNTENEEEKVVVDGSSKKVSMQVLTSHIEILQKQLNAHKTRSQEEGGLDAPSKETPEVLNAEDLVTSDQENILSQVDQGMRMGAEDGVRSSKDVEELRRENENLRVLYCQLEALYKEKQKPEKVTRMSRKDPTSRNLKIELEAAAGSSSSEEVPVLENVGGRLKKRGKGSNARRIKPKSAQKTTMEELGKQSGHDQTSPKPEEWGTSVKKATSSRKIKKNASGSKAPVPRSSRRNNSVVHHADGSMKTVLRECKEAEESTSIQDSRTYHDENGLPKRSTRKRKADSADCDETQRIPLRPVLANGSSVKSVGRARQNSSQKPEIGSLDCKASSSAKTSSSLMSNLFSAAFSIPRLNIQSSSETKS